MRVRVRHMPGDIFEYHVESQFKFTSPGGYTLKSWCPEKFFRSAKAALEYAQALETPRIVYESP